MSETYLSPLKKLISFFKDSRDKWKAKCKLAKRENKILKNHLAYLKQRNKELKAEIALLKREPEAKKNCAAPIVPRKAKK